MKLIEDLICVKLGIDGTSYREHKSGLTRDELRDALVQTRVSDLSSSLYGLARLAPEKLRAINEIPDLPAALVGIEKHKPSIIECLSVAARQRYDELRDVTGTTALDFLVLFTMEWARATGIEYLYGISGKDQTCACDQAKSGKAVNIYDILFARWGFAPSCITDGTSHRAWHASPLDPPRFAGTVTQPTTFEDFTSTALGRRYKPGEIDFARWDSAGLIPPTKSSIKAISLAREAVGKVLTYYSP